MATSNDNFADAAPVVIPAAGGTYTSPDVPNTGFTTESGEPGGGGRSAWWTYKPNENGSASFDTQLSTDTGGGTDTILLVYTGSAVGALTQVAYDDDSGGARTSLITYSVTAGTRYYIKVATYNGEVNMTYALRVTGPPAGAAAQVTYPPISSSAEMRAGLLPPVLVETPPIETEAGIPATGGILFTAASPGFAAQVSQPAPALIRVHRKLLDPAGDIVVPVLRPVFTVEVTQTEGSLVAVTLDVQYDHTGTTFSNPVTLTQDVPLTIGRNIVRLAATGDIPYSPGNPVTVVWRARLRIGGQAMSWTPAETFCVDALAGDDTAQVTWAVTGGDPDPHLWHITPASAVPGDLVTVVGQGFSDSRGRVILSGVTVPIQSWTHIPATPQAHGPGRVIDSLINRVDAEHDEIVVAVPDVAPPGGPVAVIDGDGTVPPDPPPARPMFVPLLPMWLEGSVSLDPPPPPPPPPPAPANDTFDAATPIIVNGQAGGVVTYTTSNVGATVGADEPDPGNAPGRRSLWWSLPCAALAKQGVWSLVADATGSTEPVDLVLYVDKRVDGQGVIEAGRAPGGSFPDAKINFTLNTSTASDDNWVLVFRVSAQSDVDATYNFTFTATPPA